MPLRPPRRGDPHTVISPPKAASSLRHLTTPQDVSPGEARPEATVRCSSHPADQAQGHPGSCPLGPRENCTPHPCHPFLGRDWRVWVWTGTVPGQGGLVHVHSSLGGAWPLLMSTVEAPTADPKAPRCSQQALSWGRCKELSRRASQAPWVRGPRLPTSSSRGPRWTENGQKH